MPKASPKEPAEITTGGFVVSPVDTAGRRVLGLRAGDTVRVWQKVEEKGKTRLQAFAGLLLAHKHGTEPGATFTVRKVSEGIGVERIFPLYSPLIDKIEIIRRARVRQANLYYIRDKAAREVRRQMRRMQSQYRSTESESARAAAASGEATAKVTDAD